MKLMEAIFYIEGTETLEQLAQRGGRRPIPGYLQGQVGQGSEQPGLVKDVPAQCREVWRTFNCPFQCKPLHCSTTDKLETSINNIYDTRNSVL